MPTVTVNVPEPKADPMLRQLLREFREVAEALRGMKPVRDDASSKALALVAKQQDALLRAIERMLEMVGGMTKQTVAPQLNATIREMKSALMGLADNLKEALKTSYHHNGMPQVMVKPKVTVSLTGLSQQFDRLERALLEAPRGMRNRTFGSNY